MSLAAQLERLYRTTGRGIDLGLDRVMAAAEGLGHPERRFLSIQIAGTNGKGTVSCLVAHAAVVAGLKTGLFTSPHLHRFSERIRIDGREVDDERLARHLARVFAFLDANESIALTFFEIATLTALSIFAEASVDLAVLEVGLGGRLDATSVAPPALTCITSIGLDHQAFLGETLGEIAAEKAGIARQGVPLYLGPIEGEALGAILAQARRVGAPTMRLGEAFTIPTELRPPWPGTHQRENSAVAAALFSAVGGLDGRCTPAAFDRALATVRWPGRFEWISGTPRYLLDCAHNPQAIDALVQTLDETNTRADVLLFGALRDKPVEQMLERLRPFAGQVVLVPPPISRAFDPGSVATPGDTVCGSVPDGVAAANRLTGRNGLVLVTGSVFTVGAVRGIRLGEKSDPPVGL